MAQDACRQLVTTEARVRYQTILREVCDGQNGTGTKFSPNTSGFARHRDSTSAPDSFVPSCCCSPRHAEPDREKAGARAAVGTVRLQRGRICTCTGRPGSPQGRHAVLQLVTSCRYCAARVGGGLTGMAKQENHRHMWQLIVVR